jgi:hypothetical protein
VFPWVAEWGFHDCTPLPRYGSGCVKAGSDRGERRAICKAMGQAGWCRGRGHRAGLVRRAGRRGRRHGSAPHPPPRTLWGLRAALPRLRPRRGPQALAGVGPWHAQGVRGGGRAPGALPRAWRGRGGRAVGAPRRPPHPRSTTPQRGWRSTPCKQAVSQLLRVAWETVGRVVARVATDAEQAADRLEGLRRIGIDEIASKRGHKGPDHRRRPRPRPAGVGRARPGRRHARGVLRRPRRGALCGDPAGQRRRGGMDRCDGGGALPQRHLVRRPLPRRQVGHRRAGRGPPPGLERRPQGRPGSAGWRAQGRPLRTVEEPGGPHPPPARQARLDRAGQRPAVPGVPAQGAAAAGVQAQRRAGDGAVGGVAWVGAPLPDPLCS